MSNESLALLALWAIPILVLGLSFRKLPHHAFLLSGISLGTIVSPASLGLYSLYYSGNVLGFLGLFLCFIHDSLTYAVALWCAFIPDRTVIEGVYRLKFLAISAVIWSIVYGTIGTAIDVWRHHRNTNDTA